MIVVAALVAGALGAVLRHLATTLLGSQRAVLLVNVVGSALGGVLLAVAEPDLRLVLLTGFCGGLTTFSTFSVETVQLAVDGRVARAAANAGLNLVLGVAGAAIGYLLFA